MAANALSRALARHVNSLRRPFYVWVEFARRCVLATALKELASETCMHSIEAQVDCAALSSRVVSDDALASASKEHVPTTIKFNTETRLLLSTLADHREAQKKDQAAARLAASAASREIAMLHAQLAAARESLQQVSSQKERALDELESVRVEAASALDAKLHAESAARTENALLRENVTQLRHGLMTTQSELTQQRQVFQRERESRERETSSLVDARKACDAAFDAVAAEASRVSNETRVRAEREVADATERWHSCERDVKAALVEFDRSAAAAAAHTAAMQASIAEERTVWATKLDEVHAMLRTERDNAQRSQRKCENLHAKIRDCELSRAIAEQDAAQQLIETRKLQQELQTADAKAASYESASSNAIAREAARAAEAEDLAMSRERESHCHASRAKQANLRNLRLAAHIGRAEARADDYRLELAESQKEVACLNAALATTTDARVADTTAYRASKAALEATAARVRGENASLKRNLLAQSKEREDERRVCDAAVETANTVRPASKPPTTHDHVFRHRRQERMLKMKPRCFARNATQWCRRWMRTTRLSNA